MYGKELSASEQYFGPVPQGQTWQTYESAQERLAKNLTAAAAIGATALLINPLVAGVALVGWLAYGGTSQHQHKPEKQGG